MRHLVWCAGLGLIAAAEVEPRARFQLLLNNNKTRSLAFGGELQSGSGFEV